MGQDFSKVNRVFCSLYFSGGLYLFWLLVNMKLEAFKSAMAAAAADHQVWVAVSGVSVFLTVDILPSV